MSLVSTAPPQQILRPVILCCLPTLVLFTLFALAASLSSLSFRAFERGVGAVATPLALLAPIMVLAAIPYVVILTFQRAGRPKQRVIAWVMVLSAAVANGLLWWLAAQSY